MDETFITIAKILAITVVLLSCVLFASFLMDKLGESMDVSGFFVVVVVIGIGVVVGAIAGGVMDEEYGSHLGGLIGGAIGIGVGYVGMKVIHSLREDSQHGHENSGEPK